MRRLLTLFGLTAILVVGAVLTACGSDSNDEGDATGVPGGGTPAVKQVTLRLGYFPTSPTRSRWWAWAAASAPRSSGRT